MTKKSVMSKQQQREAEAKLEQIINEAETREEVKMTMVERFVLVDAKKLQDKQAGEELSFNSKSDMMRYLYDNGMSVAQISKFMGCHYSFVYGVISSSREIVKQNTTSKSDVIREMFKAGKTVGQIAKELNSNYSFVFSVVKKFKAQLKVK